MATKPDYYEILGLDARRYDAALSPTDVKAAYRRALLEHHPDKKAESTLETIQLDKSQTVTVDDVSVAYKTLSEAGLKAQYDLFLAQSSAQPSDADVVRYTGLDTVDLDDLEYDEGRNEWRRSCRCGNAVGFVVTETQLESNVEDGELIVGCRGCSLWLRVLFGVGS